MRRSLAYILFAGVLVGILATEGFARPGGRAGGGGGRGGAANRAPAGSNVQRPNSSPNLPTQGNNVRSSAPNVSNPQAGANPQRPQSIQEFVNGPAAGANTATAPGARSAVNAVQPRVAGEPRQNLQQHPNAGQLNETMSLYAPKNEPFSPAWYADHPNAWQAANPHADAFVAATTTGLASWLAISAVSTGSDTVVYSEPVSEEGTTTTNQESTTALADSGQGAVADNAEWMQVGVFSVSQTPNVEPTRMIQLDVSREGILRGSYYDLVSDDVQTLQGAIDKTTQKAAWSVGTSNAVFATTLNALTQPSTPVTVQFANGKTATWQLTQSKP